MFNALTSKRQRTINSAGWGHVHVTTCVLALGCVAGAAQAQLRIVSVQGFSGVWHTAAGQPTAAKLWAHKAPDQSLTIGGFDGRSTFSATCALLEPERATCYGTGLATSELEADQQASHRFLYTSELRMEADTLKETWEVRIMLTPEEVKKIGKVDANLLKGTFTYERVREPSYTR